MLSIIHSEARARGVPFVPVMRLSDAPTTVRQIAETAACDARGVALRYPMFGTVSADGRGPQALIQEALDAVDVDVVGVDLIMDLGFLSEDVEVDAKDLAAAIEELVSIGNWRSVVLLGSSMPSTLGGGIVAEGTIGRLPRREWDLWSALVALHPSRLPTFGDYAVQNPEPPLEDQPTGPGQRANIRYTTDDATLVPRAVGAVIQEPSSTASCAGCSWPSQSSPVATSRGATARSPSAPTALASRGGSPSGAERGLHTTCATSLSSSPRFR